MRIVIDLVTPVPQANQASLSYDFVLALAKRDVTSSGIRFEAGEFDVGQQ